MTDHCTLAFALALAATAVAVADPFRAGGRQQPTVNSWRHNDHGPDMAGLLKLNGTVALRRGASTAALWPDALANARPNYCDWPGVGCGRDAQSNRVVELDLHNMQLVGTLDPCISELTALERLFLWANELTGELPPELGQLSQLVSLALNQNAFTGIIPVELGKLTRLQDLDVAFNKLDGPLPAALANATSLSNINVGYNQIGGELGDWVGRLTNLVYLNLGYNQMVGDLPDKALSELLDLYDIELQNNYFTGKVPSLRACTALSSASFGYNLLTEFPDDLASLTSLVGLYLSTNKFTGPIPAAICELQNLRALELDFNQLSGPVPECIGKLTRVQTLHLGTNHLNGTMPAAFANLVALKDFTVNDNWFSGPIDEAIELEICENFGGNHTSSSRCLMGGNDFAPNACVNAKCAATYCGACSS